MSVDAAVIPVGSDVDDASSLGRDTRSREDGAIVLVSNDCGGKCQRRELDVVATTDSARIGLGGTVPPDVALSLVETRRGGTAGQTLSMAQACKGIFNSWSQNDPSWC